ncbi:Ig-like domain-containing protein [Treponema sp. Marseille-Q4130]|uniref:Ig-like domain-containing protein n=1 Tax=Treponema sp. Marseille-Q4130 TaxID=2766702 RepID=UPI001652B06C|nr:Ig-like domain-containing protein [Treponema sp. Marseille-Q4130]MBC6721012.1 Ig-like domain-containing protein [Treponema sp. Marseille-Q4130]
MKTSNYARKILTGAALFMLFTGLFTGCPQNIEDKAVSVESVRLDKTELDLGVEESYKLSAAITPANANNKKITWASDNSGIAKVDQNGNVRGKADGTALITVTTEDGGKTATCTVKVKFIHIDGISFDKNELDLGIGESYKLTATIDPANASNKKITWVSDKPAIAEVDQDGNVRGKAEGTAVITATTEDGGKTATCTVKLEEVVILIPSPDKKDIYIKAESSSGNITVIGCTQTELTSGTETTLNATSDRVILKGNIRILDCHGNQLTNLYVQGLNDLESLYCYENQLTSLNMHGLYNLERLECHKNRLTNLDARSLYKLKWLDCHGNQLTSLDTWGLRKLEELDCNSNQLTSLDTWGLRNLEKLNCNTNQLTSLDVQDLNNLRWLECGRNRLTSLDVHSLNRLQYLWCYENQLTSLDVQGLNNLNWLDCSDNQLTSLDVQGLNNLNWLGCSENQLTSLNVQGLNNLNWLGCSENQLTSLNVQGLNNLKTLWCNVNKLNRDAFTKLFNDLPTRYSSDNAYCVLYTEGNGIIEGNYRDFTPDELQVIKNKNWKPYKLNKNNCQEAL